MIGHLPILNQEEIDELYARPILDKEERASYFFLSEQEKLLAQGYGSVLSQVYFILQLGYFKAKQQFHVFNIDDVQDDVKYIVDLYFDDI